MRIQKTFHTLAFQSRVRNYALDPSEHGHIGVSNACA